jgi:hypothetical protein
MSEPARPNPADDAPRRTGPRMDGPIWPGLLFGSLGGFALGLLLWWPYREDGVIAFVVLVGGLTLLGSRVGMVVHSVIAADRRD